MKAELKISETMSLPADAATQTFAIVARKRVGKTYTASVIAEEMIAAGIPIVVLDPTGAWWGLRSMADGKTEGFPVIIIGGAHGDVPLDEHGGKAIADLVVDHPGFYIVDFSAMETGAAQDRFATDFGAHFYRRKQMKRFPIHLIIDEADCFMPQQPFENQKRMLGAYDTIIRRGGISGIGVTMITQRPAVLNKNALTQAETLIALQMSGSQDVDAIEHWTRIHGSKEQRDEMISSLASLQRGEAWFWSPSWLQKFERVRIRKRKTFNSSATPEMGDKAVIKPKLAPVDLEKLGEQIKAAVQKVKDSDPAELQKKIRQLEHELKKAPTAAPAAKTVTNKIEVPALTEGERKRVTALCERIDRYADAVNRASNQLGKIQVEKDAIVTEASELRKILAGKLCPAPAPLPPPTWGDSKIKTAIVPTGDFRPDKCQRNILAVLSQFPDGCTMNKIALLARYSISGGFRNALGQLRAAGMIVGDNMGTMRITDAGMTHAHDATALPSGQALIEFWKSHPAFSLCHRQIITVLAANLDNPHGLTMEEIAGQCSPPYEISGGFRNALGELRTAGVIIGRNTDRMKLNPDMIQI